MTIYITPDAYKELTHIHHQWSLTYDEFGNTEKAPHYYRQSIDIALGSKSSDSSSLELTYLRGESEVIHLSLSHLCVTSSNSI
jgi:hypothetical protein